MVSIGANFRSFKKLGENTRNRKLTLLQLSSVQFRGIEDVDVVAQPSAPSISRNHFIFRNPDSVPVKH